MPCVLVVEDNPTTRKMLRLALVTEGYAVVEAGDGRAALAAAETTPPDLVLQDLILPDIDGFELVRRLRALPGGAELPILALSGFLSRLEEAHSNGGFTALLVKPIEPSRLVAAIRLYLPHAPVLAATGGGRPRLLIVDDDPVQLKLTRVHLSHFGFDVSVASSVADALQAARTAPIDAILSDVFMPGADGFDLCFQIRRDPAMAHVPVLLVSGKYGSTADEDLARRVGASGLVARTADLGDVAAALRTALQVRTPTAAEPPSDQLALRHARLVIKQLEGQVAATTGLVQRCGIQAGELSLLSGVADALTHRSDPDLVLRDVLAATLDAAGIAKGALILRDGSGRLALRQGIGFSAAEQADLQHFFGHRALLEEIVDHGASVAVPSPAMPEGAAHDILTGAHLAVAQIVPLISNGRGMGAMIIGGTSREVSSDDSVAFARAMGNQVVQSLQLTQSVARLTASEQRYRTLLEGASDFIAILSPDGVIREMNHQWVELTGCPAERLVGRHVGEFAPLFDTDLRAVRAHAQAAADGVATTPARSRPIEVARADGSRAFIEFSSTEVDVDGERLVFTIGRDVSGRLRAEEALDHSRQDQLRLKDEFLSHVSHELFTPVTAILQFATIMLDGLVGELSAEQRRCQQIVVRNGEQLRQMIDELFEVTRLATDARAADPAAVSVIDVVAEIVRTQQPTVRSRRVTLTPELLPGLPAAHVDRHSLERILSIVVGNAVGMTADGQTVTIRVRTSERDPGFLVFAVSDGRAGEHTGRDDKMFDAFQPGLTVEQGSRSGLGLGLFVCKELVRRQGGQIWFERQAEGGTLSFTVPAAPPCPPLPDRR